MPGFFRLGSMEQSIGSRRATRRTILSTIGAGGLGVAASIVGARPASAQASACVYNCCTLANCPNISYSDCVANAQYIWDCQSGGSGLHCACCETYGDAYSAAYCSYG